MNRAGAVDREKMGRKKRRRRRMWFVLVMLIAGLAFLLGPRVSVRGIRLGEPGKELPKWDALDAYLAEEERVFEGELVEGTEKKITWFAGTRGTPTPLSVIFLHGFSGSRGTMAPMPQNVATELRANLYCTRYAGHGRKDASGFGSAMGEAELQDWVDDTHEALEIGRRLGERVVVIANSTAAPIVSWLASQGNRYAPDALILLSPNFGPKDPRSEILLWPWGLQLVQLMKGRSYAYKEDNIYGPLHRKLATTRYPTRALLIMMASVELGRTAPLERITAPALCLYSEGDTVVSAEAAKASFERFGSGVTLLEEISSVTHGEKHVLAGDLMSPASTGEVVEKIVRFVSGLEWAPEWLGNER
jgi:pimeloyl-ACP methyl ester carboxylesterase